MNAAFRSTENLRVACAMRLMVSMPRTVPRAAGGTRAGLCHYDGAAPGSSSAVCYNRRQCTSPKPRSSPSSTTRSACAAPWSRHSSAKASARHVRRRPRGVARSSSGRCPTSPSSTSPCRASTGWSCAGASGAVSGAPADHLPHLARRGVRPGARPVDRRRRLPLQAVLAARAGRPGAGAVPPGRPRAAAAPRPRATRGEEPVACGEPAARPAAPRDAVARGARAPHRHGVPHPRRARARAGRGAHPRAAARGRVPASTRP